MIEMKVLDYRITSDDKQVIVNKARRNEHGELTILTDKDGTEKESLALETQLDIIKQQIQ